MMATITYLKFCLTCRNSAKQPTRHEEQQDPGRPAGDVVNEKLPVAHLGDAGDEWSKRPNDRDEPRQHDRDRAVFLVEFVGAHECFLFRIRDFSPEKMRGPTA